MKAGSFFFPLFFFFLAFILGRSIIIGIIGDLLGNFFFPPPLFPFSPPLLRAGIISAIIVNATIGLCFFLFFPLWVNG